MAAPVAIRRAAAPGHDPHGVTDATLTQKSLTDDCLKLIGKPGPLWWAIFLLDPDSAVAKASSDGRRYWVLEELNTRPGVTYLKKIQRGSAEA